MNQRGLLISFEGPFGGAYKDYRIKLAGHLRSKGKDVQEYHFPPIVCNDELSLEENASLHFRENDLGSHARRMLDDLGKSKTILAENYNMFIAQYAARGMNPEDLLFTRRRTQLIRPDINFYFPTNNPSDASLVRSLIVNYEGLYNMIEGDKSGNLPFLFGKIVRVAPELSDDEKFALMASHL